MLFKLVYAYYACDGTIQNHHLICNEEELAYALHKLYELKNEQLEDYEVVTIFRAGKNNKWVDVTKLYK